MYDYTEGITVTVHVNHPRRASRLPNYGATITAPVHKMSLANLRSPRFSVSAEGAVDLMEA